MLIHLQDVICVIPTLVDRTASVEKALARTMREILTLEEYNPQLGESELTSKTQGLDRRGEMLLKELRNSKNAQNRSNIIADALRKHEPAALEPGAIVIFADLHVDRFTITDGKVVPRRADIYGDCEQINAILAARCRIFDPINVIESNQNAP